MQMSADRNIQRRVGDPECLKSMGRGAPSEGRNGPMEERTVSSSTALEAHDGRTLIWALLSE